MKKHTEKNGMKKLVSLLLAFVLAAGCLFVTGAADLSAHADELTDLQDEQAALQADKAAIQAELDLLMSEQMSALEQKVLLDQQMNLTVSEIALVNDQIAAYEILITEKEAELEERRVQEEEQLAAYCGRLRAMEEAGDVTYYQIIFGASDFSDLLSRIDCVSEIMECDKTMYQDMVAAREATEAAEAALEEGKASLEAKQTELEALKAEQDLRIAEASALIQEIEANIGLYEQYESEIEAEEANVQLQIDEIIAERERIAAEEAARIEAERLAAEEAARLEQERLEQEAANSGSSDDGDSDSDYDYDDDGYFYPDGPGEYAGTGGFIWPTYTTLITSEYGNRLHPTLGYWRMHTGVDIGAGYGEAIMASKSGEVVTAAYDEGYGNYVTIYHDDGTATLYAHMSEILTYVGAYVGQGETIGLVGSTGYSTGPHLHFEIHISGGTVDPLLYLP